MPVTNAHLDEKMPWTEPGKTGMKIKPTGRPSGTLANQAGIAKNVGRLSEEERRLRGDAAPLLTCAPTPVHVTVTDESHDRPSSSPSSLAFRMLDRVIGVAVGGGRLVRRGTTGRGR